MSTDPSPRFRQTLRLLIIASCGIVCAFAVWFGIGIVSSWRALEAFGS